MNALRTLTAFLILATLPAMAARPYRGGAIATAYAEASEAGLSMLNQGGNAVDAAVAAAFAAGVAGPYHNGIGGGGFALIYDAKRKQSRILDFREVAPARASHDMFLRDGKAVPALSRDGPSSVAVPGAVAGYLTLLRQFGRLKPSVVLAPAIRLARRGIWVTPKYRMMASVRLACLRAYPESARLFLRPNGQGEPDVPALSTLLPNRDLANTLARIAVEGESAFYRGRTAAAMESAVKDGGLLTQEDLRAFRVRWREPLASHYRGHRILTVPLPSAGGVTVLQVLGQLELLTPAGFARGDVDATHTLIEAMRRSYLDRAKEMGDPGLGNDALARLVSAEHVKMLAQSINKGQASDSAALWSGTALAPPSTPAAPPPPKNTTHLSVIDREGNAVALTTTINYAFGSCVVAKGTGILLNDEMDDFAAQPMTPNVYGLVTGEANSVAPGKVPLSSMSPTLVFQKEHPDAVQLAVGAPGGPTIPTAVLQVISNVVDQKMDIVRAVAAGRIHHQWLPDVVMKEAWALDPQTQRALEAMGHHFKNVDVLGDTESVYVDPLSQLRYAASDPRGEGASMGQD